MLIAHVRVDVLLHATPAETVQLATGVARIGDSSVQMRAAVFSNGQCLAVAENVLVFVARSNGRTTPLSRMFRKRLQALLCSQE